VTDDELLAMAELAWRSAPETCTREDGVDCRAYHRLWPVLRLLGLAASPARHAGFFDEVLTDAAATGGHRRVLVTGTADHAMPMLVATAYARTGATLDLYAIDLCPTPLLLVEAAARRQGLRVTTVVDGVREHARSHPESFDLIVTHSLLTMVEPSERPLVVEGWARLLRPGGAAVTVARIDERPPPGDASAFARTVHEAVERHPAVAELTRSDRETLHAVALAYAAHARVVPASSVDELLALGAGAGMTARRVDVTEIAGPVANRVGPGGSARPGRYCEVVFARP
jgi:SAM-dependent methyltransferase